MSRVGHQRPAWQWLCAGMALLSMSIAAEAAERVAEYVNAAAAQLPAQVRTALHRIDGTPRRLLATRSYLRADDGLVDRWSWSAQQIQEYERSDRYQSLLRAVAEVTARFEKQNPGYSLFANTEVRSLDLQLERWNQNEGVKAAAATLLSSVRDELQTGSYPKAPDAAATQRFVAYLKNFPAAVPVPLAAPGLSSHGQCKAIDFQVMKGTDVIAGASVASVASAWEKRGWSAKLERAINPALGQFAGPLQQPNEPWHYEYVE